jgi:hypothetical protein
MGVFFSTFEIKSVDVTIMPDKGGDAYVLERITFLVQGEESQATYLKGLSDNTLSFWSSSTKLSDIRVHLNSKEVNIVDFRIIPQPLKNCNQATNTCLGEIKLDYTAKPYYNSKSEPIENTGLFYIEKYKPRTIKYSINPNALLFDSSDVEHIIRINDYTSLVIKTPTASKVLEANPIPTNLPNPSFPNYENTYIWKNTLLVKFSFIYEVEQSIDEEIVEFFSGLYSGFGFLSLSTEAISIIIVVIILIIFYIALNSLDKEKKQR